MTGQTIANRWTRRLTAWPWIVVLLLLFWGLTVYQLENWPTVFVDEPWEASPAYALQDHGTFGAEIFGGYAHMDQRNVHFLPLFPLMVAGVFRIAGVGLLQLRLVVAWLSMVVIALTYALGRRLAGASVGSLAVVLLLSLHSISPDTYRPSGVAMLDLARIGRYDVLAPVCGLAALLLFYRGAFQAGDDPQVTGTFPLSGTVPSRSAGHLEDRSRWLAIGALLGLATLTHPVGGFWALAVGGLILWRFRRRAAHKLGWIALVGLVLWLPWLAFIAADPAEFVTQNRGLAERFDLSRPGFYLENLLNEPSRYPLDLHLAQGWTGWLRPGAALVLIGLPLALTWLIIRAVRGDWGARILVVPLGTIFGCLALLVSEKFFNHTFSLWPLIALALAWAGVQIAPRCAQGHASQGLARDWRWEIRGRSVLIWSLLALIILEGGQHIWQSTEAAGQVTPYREYTGRIASYLRPGERVLGLHHWWLGMPGADFRSFLVVFYLTQPKMTAQPVSFGQALAVVRPQVILLDHWMTGFFTASAQPTNPDHQRYLDFMTYLQAHQAHVVGEFQDKTFGETRIYRLDAP